MSVRRILQTLGLRARKPHKYSYTFDIGKICPDLAPELRLPVQLKRIETQPDLRGGLATQFISTPGAHKWHHYFGIYEELFGSLPSKPIRLLEVGVYKGASAKVWRNWFHPDSTIVGLDIDPECARFDSPAENKHVRIGPQQDHNFLATVTNEFGPFDLIIDDGSHMTSHQIASFNCLFDAGLKPGGLYFVEDTHTNVWQHYRDSPRSFFEFCCGLAECLYAPYATHSREQMFRVGDPMAVESVTVPRITTLIREVRFLDSVIAISKARNATLPQSQHW